MRKLKEKKPLIFTVLIAVLCMIIAFLIRNIYLNATAGPYEVTRKEIADYFSAQLNTQ